jgi:hypothetical protein
MVGTAGATMGAMALASYSGVEGEDMAALAKTLGGLASMAGLNEDVVELVKGAGAVGANPDKKVLVDSVTEIIQKGKPGDVEKFINLFQKGPFSPTSNSGLFFNATSPSRASEADDARARLLARTESYAAIAAAEAQYQSELKAAQDKLAATKASWLAKLNG